MPPASRQRFVPGIPVHPVVSEVFILPDQSESGLFQYVLAARVGPDRICIQGGKIQVPEGVADRQRFRPGADPLILVSGIFQGDAQGCALVGFHVFEQDLPDDLLSPQDGQRDPFQIL